MNDFKSLKSSGIFSAFFALQAIGYIHGHGQYGKIDLENTFSFGVYHLGHIFQPFSAVGWPLSPTICGLLLATIPFLEWNDSKPLEQHKNLVSIFIAVFIPLSISILVVSVFGYDYLTIKSVAMAEDLGHHIFRKLLYFASYSLFVYLGLRYMARIKFALKPVLNYIPKQLLLLFAMGWLLYGCYVGSRLDGAVDQKSGNVEMVHKFFPEQEVTEP